MVLAPLVVAAVLGQAPACPAPTSVYGPPPCAAANVTGCLPGYVRRYDSWGRVIYACDPAYAGLTLQAPTLPAPRSAQPYAPRYAPAPPRAAGEGRGQLALVLLPGGTTGLVDRAVRHAEATGGVAVELRGRTGGARLRLGLEYASFGKVADVALKYDFNDAGELRPFVALALGGASVDPDPAWRLAAAASAGVDVYASRNVFLTVELKERGFVRSSSGPAHGLEVSTLRQTALFAGLGFYL